MAPRASPKKAFEAKLDPRNPVYRERIKDTRGVDRYVLSIVPLGPLGDNNITSWQVKLADLRHSIYDNILLASQVPSPDPKDNLWWLTPRRYAAVSIDARRVIKVDGFYVVFQVKAYHFTPLDSPYLDSMTVQVRFTNSDPRLRREPLTGAGLPNRPTPGGPCAIGEARQQVASRR